MAYTSEELQAYKELKAKKQAAPSYTPEELQAYKELKADRATEFPSERFARFAEPISQFGGAFARKMAVGVPLAGLATGGVEGIKQVIQQAEGNPEAPTTSAEAARRIGMAGARGALGEGLGRGVFGLARNMGPIAKEIAGPKIGGALNKFGEGITKTASQLMKVSAGIDEKVAERVLIDSGRLSRAKSVEEAGRIYGEAMKETGLEQGPKAAMELIDASTLGQGGAEKFAFEAISKMNQGNLKYQEALVARDMLKNVMRQPKFNNPQLAQNEAFYKEMQSTLDSYLEPYFKEAGTSFEKARKMYSEAMDKKAFSSWLPQNATKTASVLRGFAGAGLLGSGYASDNPALTAAGLATMSPRMLGYGIRAAQSPITREIVKGGVRLGTQAGAGAIFPSSTSEALRRKYQGLK